MVRNIGSGIGISIVSTILSRHIQINHVRFSEHINIFNYGAIMDLLATNGYKTSKVLTAALMDLSINIKVQVIAYLNCFGLMTIVTIIAIPIVFLLKKNDITFPAQVSHHI